MTCPKCNAVFKARGARSEDEDIPDAEFDDEEPTRARSRRQRDDDDDEDRRPSRRDSDSRSRRRRDDDDNRPVRRRPERDDEERPRSRRRDDDEDDRPRGRSRRKKRVNPLLIILPVGGGVLLVIAIISYFAFFRGSSPFGGVLGGGDVPQSDMVAWAPAETTSAVYLDYAVLNKHPAVDKDNMFGLGKVPRYGLQASEVQAVFHADNMFDGVTVIRTTGPLDQATMDRVVRTNSGVQATANGKTYYRLPNGRVLYKGGDRLLVVASREPILTQRLGNDEGKVVVSSKMRDYLSRASGELWAAKIAGTGTFTINGEPVEGTIASITFSGDFIEQVRETTFVNGSAADRVVPQLRNQPDTTVSTSGSTLTIKTRRRSDFPGGVSLMEFLGSNW